MRNTCSMQRIFGLALAAAFLMPLTLSTAALSAPPSSTEPSAVMKGLQEEKRPPSRLEETVVVPKEEVEGKGLSTQKVFTLKAVVLDDTAVYKGVNLGFLIQDMLGQQVSFSDLNKIAQRMTRRYREDGYIFSRAVLPPQKVTDGVVHLRAVEGRIVNVQLVGTFNDESGLIRRFADKIKSAGAANTKEIERYLLLIDDLPGITAKSFVKPSATRGGGDLIINISQDPFEGSVSADNRGSDFIGPYKGTLVGAFNNTFDRHDRTTLRMIATANMDELVFGDVVHEQQFGSSGFKMKARAAMTETEPGGSVEAQQIDGKSRTLDLEAIYPLARSRAYNINLLAGFNMLNSQTEVLGVQTALDRVRAWRVGAHFDFTDPFKGINQIDMAMTHGLDMLGATEDGAGRSRGNGEHQFFKSDITATRIQEIYDRWSMMLSATAQTSRDALLASEEFGVGGGSYGRAYDSGEITGDHGYAGVAELRYGGPVNSDFVQSYQAYTFLDYGTVSNKAPAAGEVGRDSLASAGVGVRFNVINNYSGYLEFDKPLNQVVTSEGDDDYRMFFSLLKRF